MSVGKGEGAGAIMVGGGKVSPLCRVDIVDEEAFVDAVRVLVDREPRHRRIEDI